MHSPISIRQGRGQSPTSHPTPMQSLRRLRTAFSPTRRSFRSVSPSSSTGTTSPLTSLSTLRTGSPDSHRSRSSSNSSSSLRQLLALRRKPSVLDLELEEERCLFECGLDVLEPRPCLGMGRAGVDVGIFEVLEGRV